MVGISVLWLPILVSAAFVFVTLMIIHMIPGWHQRDMIQLPGEEQVLETLRRMNVQPGEYRFPYGNTTKEMEAPAFVEKMKRGPVGTMTIRPNGELPFGRMLGQWFVYSLFIAVLAACITSRACGPGAPFLEVFRISGAVTFCCYAVAHWQNWIWWGRSTRVTLTHSVDGLMYAVVTGVAFGWLWPR
ncbi:MAG TPA: hypothetical protein VHI13_10360 [Candidatus Kapabacteria bacterium]|nr:hypothetical protein [Candidatus Kapabacteria bacterium]